VNEYGAVYESQSPPVRRTLLRTLPKSLLNDVATFEVSVGEKFLAEITDDASDRIALLGLQPLSGASIPIVSPDGLRRGVLIACSTERPADSSMFERLNGLTRVVGVRFAELQPNWRTVPEFRQDRFWERLRDRALGLDVYRSAGCDIPWRYRMLGEASGLLTLGFQDDGELCERLIGARCASELGRNLADQLPRGPCFASTIDFSLQSMNYAARYFSPPVILSPMGPTATIGSWGAMVAGTAKLPAGASAFICDRGLSSWLQHKNPTIASLPALLDSENPAGLASIVTLGCPPL
jgi:hypothetical protein